MGPLDVVPSAKLPCCKQPIVLVGEWVSAETINVLITAQGDTTLSANATPASQDAGRPVNVSVNATTNTPGVVPSGDVVLHTRFPDREIARATLSGSGTATFTTRALSPRPAPWQLYVTYGGDNSSSDARSAPMSVTITKLNELAVTASPTAPLPAPCLSG